MSKLTVGVFCCVFYVVSLQLTACRNRTFNTNTHSSARQASTTEVCQGLENCLQSFEAKQRILHAQCNKPPEAAEVASWKEFLNSKGTFVAGKSAFSPFSLVPSTDALVEGYGNETTSFEAAQDAAYLSAGQALLAPFLSRRNWRDEASLFKTEYFVSTQPAYILKEDVAERMRALGREKRAHPRVQELQSTLEALHAAALSAPSADDASMPRLAVYRYIDDATVNSKSDAFLNAFETHSTTAQTETSKGLLGALTGKSFSSYLNTRIVAEAQILSGLQAQDISVKDPGAYAKHLSAQERAKYAILGVWNATGPQFGAYGNVLVEFQLSPELAKRTTLTRFDSAVQSNPCARQAVGLWQTEHALAFAANKLGEILPQLGRTELTLSLTTAQNAEDWSWYGDSKSERTRRAQAFIDATRDRANALFDDIAKKGAREPLNTLEALTLSLQDNELTIPSARYIEAQIWGALNWSHVRSVVVPEKYRFQAALEQKICASKKDIRVYERSFTPGTELKPRPVVCR